MDINSVVQLYNNRQIDAQTAFELLKKDNLFAKAFMRLISHYHEDMAALLSFALPSV